MSWNERQGAYYAVKSRATFTSYDLKNIEQWNVLVDIENQLKTVGAILIGGVPTAPRANSSQVGGISHGRVLAADQDELRGRRRGWW